MNRAAAALAVVLWSSWGCWSPSSSTNPDAAAFDSAPKYDGGERAASVIGGSAGNVYGGICPPSRPMDGASCGSTPGFCQYGDDPRLQFCLTNAACSDGGWQVLPPQDSCPPAPDPGPCPASADEARDQPCAVAGSFCVYGSTPCGCTGCGVSGSFAEGSSCSRAPTWHCAGPYRGSDPRCPPYLRNLGTVCDIEGASCCLGCLCYTCSGGVWTGPPPPTQCVI